MIKTENKVAYDMPMEDRVQWTTMHLQRLKEGGVWLIPRTSSMYIIYHSEKSAARIGMGDSAVEEVLTEMGWKVT